MAIAEAVSVPPDIMDDETTSIVTDPVEAARAAGLRYMTDSRPGIQRKRAGKHFSYIGLDGQPIHDKKVLERIKKLGIPPAWTDVWICPSPRGHLQATGRDARGRKQYRYHETWRQVRDETKFYRMIAFGEALPRIRQAVDHDLSFRSLSREKVLATVVRLLDKTAIRVGNEEYARENNSFGLTTLQNQHVDVEGNTLHFHFRGKSGKEHTVDLRDPRVARSVKRCMDLPGYEIFQYIDEHGDLRSVDSADVNEYIRAVSGEHFTAKDFRTWHGTVTAALALHDLGPADTVTGRKHAITAAVKATADHLGNTPAIARKSYVHPGILQAYEDGTLLDLWREAVRMARIQPSNGLHPEEVATLAVLRSQLETEQKAS